ncbi:hypothetical protein [Selenomonas ruminantium]|uniref:hypothetical protein n=1 Tax=Selenomonas ruminantium TaxID=971 RepID=UPI0026EF18E7|nr:hypothetical protein [Selenomonas ruminantium]
MISATMIDNKLGDISFYGYIKEEYAYRNAADSIQWYVRSGRASTPWIKALLKATPEKILAYIVESCEYGSTEEQVKLATKYLRRYCRLDKDMAA